MSENPFALDGAGTFLTVLQLPDGSKRELYLPARWTVDQVKTYFFKQLPELQGKSKFDFHLGISETDLVTVEFARFVKADRRFEAAYLSDKPVNICLFPRKELTLRGADVPAQFDPSRRRASSVLSELQHITPRPHGSDAAVTLQRRHAQDSDSPTLSHERAVLRSHSAGKLEAHIVSSEPSPPVNGVARKSSAPSAHAASKVNGTSLTSTKAASTTSTPTSASGRYSIAVTTTQRTTAAAAAPATVVSAAALVDIVRSEVRAERVEQRMDRVEQRMDRVDRAEREAERRARSPTKQTAVAATAAPLPAPDTGDNETALLRKVSANGRHSQSSHLEGHNVRDSMIAPTSYPSFVPNPDESPALAKALDSFRSPPKTRQQPQQQQQQPTRRTTDRVERSAVSRSVSVGPTLTRPVFEDSPESPAIEIKPSPLPPPLQIKADEIGISVPVVAVSTAVPLRAPSASSTQATQAAQSASTHTQTATIAPIVAKARQSKNVAPEADSASNPFAGKEKSDLVYTPGAVLGAIAAFRKLSDVPPPGAVPAQQRVSTAPYRKSTSSELHPYKSSSSSEMLVIPPTSESADVPASMPSPRSVHRPIEKKPASTDLRGILQQSSSLSRDSSSGSFKMREEPPPASSHAEAAQEQSSKLYMQRAASSELKRLEIVPPAAPEPASDSDGDLDMPEDTSRARADTAPNIKPLEATAAFKAELQRSESTLTRRHSRSRSQTDLELMKMREKHRISTHFPSDPSLVPPPLALVTDAGSLKSLHAQGTSVDDWLNEQLRKEQSHPVDYSDEMEEMMTPGGTEIMPKRKRRSFHLPKFMPGPPKTKRESEPSSAIDEKASTPSLASRFMSSVQPLLPRNKTNMTMSRKKFGSKDVVSSQEGDAVVEPPQGGFIKRSLSESDGLHEILVGGDQLHLPVADMKSTLSLHNKSKPDDSPMSAMTSSPSATDDLNLVEFRALGGALAHQRQPPPVTHTAQETIFQVPSVAACKGWIVERPSDVEDADSWKQAKIEFTEATGNLWYKEYFTQAKDVRHVIGVSKDHGPFVVSAYIDGKKSTKPIYKALLKTQDGDDLLTFPTSAVRTSVLRNKASWKELLRVMDPRLNEGDVSLLEIPDKSLDSFSNDMVTMEEKQLVKAYKFGVMYVKAGQDKEEEMFGNERGSPAFDKFLETIGERVKLLEWKKFRAGLDTTRNTTGTESIYTTYDEYEIMFHVSTMLPYRKQDAQQLERKRHIGNDICLIIYREGEALKPYRPNTIESEFNHVLIVVDYNGDPENPKDSDTYSISVVKKYEVPEVRPRIPAGFVFQRDADLRNLLLRKLINGENACFQAPVFANKFRRTRFALYKNLFDVHSPKP